ncbi:MAG: hypothetical protein IBJ18_01560 [Phycisphaerales bacterium]|nr:hypothetical protein [Phycisphaerales bacterium]
MKPLRSPGELAPELADLLDQLAHSLAVLRDDWREEIDAARPELDPDGEWIVPYVDLWRGESSGLRTDAAAWLEAWRRLAKRPAKAKQTIERMVGIDEELADTFARAEAIAVEVQTSLDVSGDVTVKPIHLDDGVWAVRRVRAARKLWHGWITTHPLERSPIESGPIVGQLAQSAEDWKHHAEAFAAASDAAMTSHRSASADVGLTSEQIRGDSRILAALGREMTFDTFRRIRKAAGMKTHERGHSSRNRRYTPEEITRMADATERGPFIDRQRIALALRNLAASQQHGSTSAARE